MDKTIRNTLIVLAILILAGSLFFAGSMFARFRSFAFGGMMGNYGWNTTNNGTYGPGMMGNYGRNTGTMAPTVRA